MRKQVAFLLLFLVIGCDKGIFEGKTAKLEREAREREAQLMAFAARHGADAPWFKGKLENEEFTAVYQAALFKSLAKPLAFKASLEDVVLESGQTIARFEVMDTNPNLPTLELRLWVEMDGPVFPVIKSLGKSYSTCFVVAKDLNPRLENGDFGESLVAHGVCMAVEKQ